MSVKITKIVNDLNSSSTAPSSSSNRKSLIQRNRVFDQHSRDRRRRQQLAQLERDNFHDDPHANLVMHKKAPKFEDTISATTPNRKSASSAFKIKSLAFSVLVEDDLKSNPMANYSNAVAPAPDAMYVPNADLRRRFFNDWLTAQSDKEPNENELNSSSDENDLMEVDEKNDAKKGREEDKNLNENSDDSYKRILNVVKRHFCCVCGFKAPYTCVTCGMRYCCSTCLKTHKDTRCLKWTV